MEKESSIYILGGKDAEGNRTNSVEIFNYAKETWQ